MWIGQREIGIMAAVVPEICVRLGIIDAVGGIPSSLRGAHLLARSRSPWRWGRDRGRPARRVRPGCARTRSRRTPGARPASPESESASWWRSCAGASEGWENPRPQSALLVKSIRGDRSSAQLCFKRRGAFEGHSDGRFSVMADLASAKKTLDGLVKAYAAGDAAKTASLIGTLKVRAPRSRAR